MAELLLEIFSEEIPARMQARGAEDLARLVGESLKAQGLEAKSLRAVGGPRRLTLVADGLPKAQPDTTEERKGPQVGAPEQALQGFMKAAGLTSIDQAEVREMPKGKFYFSVATKKGRPTVVVLKEIVEAALAQLPWPKSMRWGTNPTRWVRPLHSIVCLFDGAVVPVEFARVKAGNTTVGHRFLAPAQITVKNAADYTAKLKKSYVVVEPGEREQIISRDLAKLAAAEGLSVRADAGLLSEVIGLVEWPVPLLGTIPDAFMDVPAEVMTSAMRKHQKYFALSTKSGAFANRFGVIANMVTKDKGKAIIAGNERVLSARLSDAKFFWDQDREQPLASRVEKLQERVFQASLGTVLDKTKRLVRLAGHLAGILNADTQAAERAALLCKADLSTGMVGEFPDLQGVMGRYYALHDKEPSAVADAIAEHYSPLGPTDACPSKALSIVVSLADKLDSLVGFFAINEKPTGSKDPYALRRAALGVIRIILENKLRLPLRAAFGHALAGYDGLKADTKKVSDEVLDFFADRLKVYLREKGVRHDYVSAVFALGTEDDLVRLIARVDALAAFLSSDDGANLLVAYKRAANILRIEEKKDNKTYTGDVGDLGAEEAHALLTALGAINAPVAGDLSGENFEAAMQKLAKLRAPVDVFFDKVTVNADNAGHRVERLKLLAQIVAVVDQVADFSKIEG
ncbi:MAG: glycine--tRNA ligase subunit beta [Proteobacteria bacterium]|nr:glycine--tRNA ligase subunit beta [Pseudomonadota bacterium]